MKQTLAEIAKLTGARLVGDGATEISGVAALDSATAADLVFVEEEKLLPLALASKAGAIVAGEFARGAEQKPGSPTSPVLAGWGKKPLLLTDQPRLAFARAARALVRARRHEVGVHSTAILHHTVKLGRQVSIQAHAVLAEGVEVGDHTRIGPGVVIGENVKIGAHCNLAGNVTIYADTRIGDRVTAHAGVVLGADGFGYVRDAKTGRYTQFPQLGVLVIEDEVEIGANSTIDRGALGETRIGAGTKIDNLVHIGHNVRIGRNVIIAAQGGISGSVVIEDDVVMGGKVGICDHVRIEQGVIMGARSSIFSHKVVRGKGTIYCGTPARPLPEFLKGLAVLARLAKKS
jgi:UDP-3-O-[3-hydroxymyristoyl] glucosamine N-acyltransferase